MFIFFLSFTAIVHETSHLIAIDMESNSDGKRVNFFTRKQSTYLKSQYGDTMTWVDNANLPVYILLKEGLEPRFDDTYSISGYQLCYTYINSK